VKNSPARATGAHIALIGHITAQELRRYLTVTESANGFGNRFLWFCVKRSKALPFGGHVPETELADLQRRLAEARDFAVTVGEMHLDQDARQAWAAVYPELSEGQPGLAGALLARGEAHVMRLAALYALLDQSNQIGLVHLQAALALWEYAEASVLHIFGDDLGDPVADEILRALRSSPAGLTRTEISTLFGRHQTAAAIGKALAALLVAHRAHFRMEGTTGRSTERWCYGRAKEAKDAKEGGAPDPTGRPSFA
jgi:hypothetical protein